MNMTLTFVIIATLPAVSAFTRMPNSQNIRNRDSKIDLVKQDFTNSLFSSSNHCCSHPSSSRSSDSSALSPLFLRHSGGSSGSSSSGGGSNQKSKKRSSTSRGIKKHTKTVIPSSSKSKSSNKNNKKEKLLYSPTGYIRGDVNTCKEMFDTNCDAASGTLSYDSLVESRYLRYWPGKLSQAERIWNDIIGSCELGCSFQEMVEIHALLDEISLNVEVEMEHERICWDIDDLNYENMINFFHDNTTPSSSSRRGRSSTSSINSEEDDDDDDSEDDTDSNDALLLPFHKFLQWEFIQAELWFHDSKGLTQSTLAEMWCRYVGSIHTGMDFDRFGELYNEVCDFKYQL